MVYQINNKYLNRFKVHWQYGGIFLASLASEILIRSLRPEGALYPRWHACKLVRMNGPGLGNAPSD